MSDEHTVALRQGDSAPELHSGKVVGGSEQHLSAPTLSASHQSGLVGSVSSAPPLHSAPTAVMVRLRPVRRRRRRRRRRGEAELLAEGSDIDWMDSVNEEEDVEVSEDEPDEMEEEEQDETAE
jgi:hypothetical protein